VRLRRKRKVKETCSEFFKTTEGERENTGELILGCEEVKRDE
jgi:hypothetical protein